MKVEHGSVLILRWRRDNVRTDALAHAAPLAHAHLYLAVGDAARSILHARFAADLAAVVIWVPVLPAASSPTIVHLGDDVSFHPQLACAVLEVRRRAKVLRSY